MKNKIKWILYIAIIFISFSFNAESCNKKVIRVSSLNLSFKEGVDHSNAINQLLVDVEGKNFIVDFDCDNDYNIGTKVIQSTIVVRSKTKIKFSGRGFLRLCGPSKGGAALTIAPESKDIEIDNIQIDGGGDENIQGNSGQNGIGIGNCSNIRICGGIIKNCSKGKDEILDGAVLLGDGGKGIQVEPHNVDNCVIDGVIFQNCHAAISCHRNLSIEGAIDVTFQNIVARDCSQFAIIQQTNGEDFDGSQQKVFIKNFQTENCGSLDGVFIFSRARYLEISNGNIKGDTIVDAIFRGRASNTMITDIIINQPCKNVIDLNPSRYGVDERKTKENYYSLVVNSEFDYLVSSDTTKIFPNRTMLNSLVECKTIRHPRKQLFTDQVVNSGSSEIKMTYEVNKP